MLKIKKEPLHSRLLKIVKKADVKSLRCIRLKLTQTFATDGYIAFWCCDNNTEEGYVYADTVERSATHNHLEEGRHDAKKLDTVIPLLKEQGDKARCRVNIRVEELKKLISVVDSDETVTLFFDAHANEHCKTLPHIFFHARNVQGCLAQSTESRETGKRQVKIL